MARRKTKKKSGGFFSRFRSNSKKRTNTTAEPAGWKVRLKIAGIIGGWTLAAAGICVGFYYLRGYIHQNGQTAQATGPIELTNAPDDWLGEEWLRAITTATGGNYFPLNDQSAHVIAENLERLSWMYDVRVRITPKHLKVTAKYRKPAVRIQTTSGKWVYLDAEGVVLDYLPVDTFAVLEIRGLSWRTLPPPGNQYHSEAATAVILLLEILQKMDEKCCPEKPLLNEIAYVDVTHFGTQRSKKPHLILTAKDGTEAFWGAAYGQASAFLEANETEKLTKLYNFYQQNNNTLQGKVKSIELRTPRTQLPRPQR